MEVFLLEKMSDIEVLLERVREQVSSMCLG